MLDKLNCFNFYTCFRSIHIGLPCPFLSSARSSYLQPSRPTTDLAASTQPRLQITTVLNNINIIYEGLLATAARSMALTRHISWQHCDINGELLATPRNYLSPHKSNYFVSKGQNKDNEKYTGKDKFSLRPHSSWEAGGSPDVTSHEHKTMEVHAGCHAKWNTCKHFKISYLLAFEISKSQQWEMKIQDNTAFVLCGWWNLTWYK